MNCPKKAVISRGKPYNRRLQQMSPLVPRTYRTELSSYSKLEATRALSSPHVALHRNDFERSSNDINNLKRIKQMRKLRLNNSRIDIFWWISFCCHFFINFGIPAISVLPCSTSVTSVSALSFFSSVIFRSDDFT